MSTYEAIKDAIQIAKKLNQTELYEQLLEVKERLSELREDNLAKGEQIKQLSEQLALKASIEFDKSVYWIRNDPVAGGEKDTPICPKCYDVDKNVVRQSLTKQYGGLGFYCVNCQCTYIAK